ncbi:hypothetical protein DRW07_07845 [Alteromonas sediminis]|uniref:Uncharacterized protein n=1 Tax=Alteromonas sediminis TaxID=2259342 RepID=A0A3N5Z915_9ALTE|nr:hypothetical protein [Alteromonas sediminis]RPJ67424.1 hypothetical protein DRW07_07845 [Alteromonas sediminis]
MKYYFFLSLLTFSISFCTQAEEKGWLKGLMDDFSSTDMEGGLTRREARQWYKENKGMLVINGGETLGCRLDNDSETAFSPQFVREFYACTFKAEFVNHTNYKLETLIVKIKIFNKAKSSLVVERVIGLPISIFPSVKKKESIEFIAQDIGEARAQLGSNWSWNYELIGYLPKEYTDSDYKSWHGDYSWLTN